MPSSQESNSKKWENLKPKYLITTEFLPKNKNWKWGAASVSFQVACLLAQPEKPFDGKLMKTCLIAAAEEMCSERTKLFRPWALRGEQLWEELSALGSVSVVN